MKKILRQIILLFFCSYSFFFLICSTLAPIFAKLKFYELSSKLHFLLMFSCHQQPDRSFWLLGYPVSLCCRCYGFYIGVFLSIIFLLINRFKINLKVVSLLFIFVIVDLFVNFILHIDTGNISRFIIGNFMGIIFVYIINSLINLFLKGERNV